MDRCDECLFVYSEVPGEALPELLRGLGARYATALGAAPDQRRRPAEGVWSPLEYTCHVRDVLRVQGERLALALRVDAPEFVPMGRDERAVTERYNEQEPASVLAELATAADDLAARFAVLGPAELARTGVYPWPQRQARTLLWLGQHTIHEGEHHLLDIRRATGAGPGPDRRP
ncbi:DinB family protein [Micromonospora soli]|uniref:DinB family protein n=1 Tax=Micromonospora sp. NBRC 110009 TaxID=3061627 RepID=UPI002673F74A|nr:DinB family protein [Micromonospora sp. NBRC 110009]WKT97326.1 DinB family protein [Micromonospora sp. NBRC 110009]